MKEYGFTMVELMITLVIAAILLAIGVPGFSAFIQNSRIDTQTQTLRTSLNFAREEAVKRAAPVSVCRSNNQTGCAGNWEDGWLVFVDADRDGVVDAGDTLLRVVEPLSGGNTLAYGHAANYLGFDSQGFLHANLAGTFTLCDSRGAASAQGIEVVNTGRSRAVNAGLVCP